MRCWQAVLPHAVIEPALRAWLMSRGSLTAKLRAAFPGLQVSLVRQCKAAANPDEAAALGLRPAAHAWVREVVLHAGGMPLVFAHTVLPLPHLRGAWNLFCGLGARPLGEVLFADPGICRGPLAYCALDARHPLHRQAARALPAHALPASLWARRSTFARRGRSLLVSEVFLPAITEIRS